MLANILILLIAMTGPAGKAEEDLEARRKAFQKLLDEQWEYTLSHSPEFASILGDKRWNDKLSDLSIKAILADQEMDKVFLKKFEAVDPAGFPEQEALTRTLLVRSYRESIEDAHWKNWEMPETQIGGLHLYAPQLVSLLSFETVRDYEDYAARLQRIPKQFEDVTEAMRRGMADKLVPPKFLLSKVADQAEGVANAKPEESPFAVSLGKMPKSFSAEDTARLRKLILDAVSEKVDPAYKRFARFVREEYAPQGRAEPGMWALPDGLARYATVVKRQTTTSRTPEEIHEIGLQQVTRIEREAEAVAEKLGFKDWKALNSAIEKDPQRHFHSREEVLALYRKYIDQMKPQLPRLFGRLPRADLLVMPVEEFREKEASAAQYTQGAPDGSRPGHVMVNTGNPESRKTISVESTAYHEGVPGHHLQISIAQELEGLPPVRQQSFYAAFVEGWALYSERLGKEIGFYQDPYSDFGRLQDEMLRAIRLVVDTGLHAKKWTRQQVVDFFHAHSAIDEVEVQSETDRYISDPGQALAYMTGQLKILELRAKAQKELGDRFDIRAFHDAILDAGALPLDVLETRIDAWIAQRRKA
jgi:uncharacterized protein (DUF885 family)